MLKKDLIKNFYELTFSLLKKREIAGGNLSQEDESKIVSELYEIWVQIPIKEQNKIENFFKIVF